MAAEIAAKKRVAKVLSEAPTVLYVYAITRAPRKSIAAPQLGIDGNAPVVPVALSDVICWVSAVDAREFGEELQERMESLDWLASAGVRHQQVVAALAEQTDVLPARFGTVFTSEEVLRADLKRRGRAIRATLKRIANSDEWGVKVFADTQRRVTESTRGDVSGREYLKRKAAVLEERGTRSPDAEVMQLAKALRKHASSMAPVGKVSSGQRNLLWQGAFLVKRGAETKFHQVLRQFASKWKGERILECTGPWPPYSFVSRDGR